MKLRLPFALLALTLASAALADGPLTLVYSVKEHWKGRPNKVVYTHDGSAIFVAAADNSWQSFAAADGKDLTQFNVENQGFNGFGVSPDSKYVAGSGSKYTAVWEAATGAVKSTLDDIGSEVRGVAFSPDGSKIAEVDRDYNMAVLNPLTGKALWKVQQACNYDIVWTPDGKRLFTAGDNSSRMFAAYDAANGKKIWEVPATLGTGRCIGISADGKLVAGGVADNTIRILSASTGGALKKLTMANTVVSVAFSPNGKYLAASDDDGNLGLWDTSSWKQLSMTKPGMYELGGLQFSPDSKFLAGAGGDWTLWVWRIAG